MRTKKEKIKLTIKKNVEITKDYVYNLTLSELIKCVKDNEPNDETFYKDDNIIIKYINGYKSIINTFISIESKSWNDYDSIDIYFEKDNNYRITYHKFKGTICDFKGIKLDVYKVSDFVKHTERFNAKSSFIDKHFGRLKGDICTLRVYGYIRAKSLRLSHMYDIKCLQDKLNDKLSELDYYKTKNALFERHPNICTTWWEIASEKDFKRMEKRIETIKAEIKEREQKVEECNERINKLKVKNYNYASEIH